MNREFFVNIIFLITANLLIKPLFIFGIDRNVQNLVGEQTYGVYYTLISFTFLFQIINDFGIQNFNSREIAQHRQLLDKYFPNILGLKIILGGIYFIFVFFFAFFTYTTDRFPMLLQVAINPFLFSLLGYLRSNVASLGMYRLNSLLTIFDRLLMIIICSVLLFIEPFRSHFQIMWFIQAQNFSLFVTVCIAFGIVYKKVNFFKFRFNLPFYLSILRGSMPYALTFFLMGLYTRTDVVMMERMLPNGAQQAGIYASAYRLLDAVNMMGFLFATLLFPMFARVSKSSESVVPLMKFSYQLIMVASVSLAVAVWFHRVDIMHLLYREATPYSGDVLGVLMLSFVAMSGTYIYSTFLGANGSVSSMNKGFTLAILLNVVLNLVLIPKYQALGAATSTLITQAFVMFMSMFLTKKALLLRGDTVWILKIIGFISSVILIDWALKTTHFMDNWLVQLAISIAASLLLALIFGFLNYKKIESILSGGTQRAAGDRA